MTSSAISSYRKINDVTKADQYPIPRIDDILSQFAGKAYFSTFDANKGFHQIEIAPQDREKTAFRTHRGLHQYKRMPFGVLAVDDNIVDVYKGSLPLESPENFVHETLEYRWAVLQGHRHYTGSR
jgi:hypothetical protein